jgi:hypothetical protein
MGLGPLGPHCGCQHTVEHVWQVEESEEFQLGGEVVSGEEWW